MRVVQLLPELNEGGVERGVVELSRELVKRGVESVVVSAGGRLAEQIEADGGRHVAFDVASKNPLTAWGAGAAACAACCTSCSPTSCTPAAGSRPGWLFWPTGPWGFPSSPPCTASTASIPTAG